MRQKLRIFGPGWGCTAKPPILPSSRPPVYFADADPTRLAASLKRLELKARRKANSVFMGEYRSAFRGAGLEVDQIRPYEYGDDVRSIDWNVTARTGQLHIKTFREEREQAVLVLLDVSASQAVGGLHHQKAFYGLEVAALLGFSAVRSNDRFGLLLASAEVERYFAPRKGRSPLLTALRAALAIRPRSGGTHLARGLDFLHRNLGRHAHIVVVSDFLDSGFEAPLARLAARHDVLLIRTHHPAEALGPGMGILPVAETEGGATGWVFAGLALPRLWGRQPQRSGPLQRRFAELDARLTQWAATHRKGYLALDTTQDYAPPLQSYFHERAKRRFR